MSSEELIKLKKDYILFKDNLDFIIKENTDALGKLSGADNYMREGYALNGEPIDEGYLRTSVDTLNETCTMFRRISANVSAKIAHLNKDIEKAIDKELAEKIAMAGGQTNGSKM